MRTTLLSRFLIFLGTLALQAQTYDIVVLNGRVMDPETGLDAVRNIGISEGKISAIGVARMQGKTTIDARGLIVGPGFIDLHAHGQDEENQRYQAMDGVTTALELEIGAANVDAWYNAREGKRLIHSGVSAGHVPNRMEVMHDPNRGFVPSGDAARKPATGEEIAAMRRRLATGLEQGALGVGFGVQYTPAASRDEIFQMFRVAGNRKAPVFVHIRHMGDREPGNALNALEEVIAAAVVTGAPLHVVHISSVGLKATPALLDVIGMAQKQGLDITTECYPYSAGQTELQSAMFDDGWQKVLDADYPSLEWPATGERLTAETFAKYRKIGGMVILHVIPESVVRLAVASALTMIASDGYIHEGKGHPRGAGTYSRVLGRYVRETNALTWMDALRKMTLMPAQRLEKYAPAMRTKGRVQVGADADLTIFDPDRVIDNATFQKPALFSSGIQYVLVNGTPIVIDGQLKTATYPGRPIRANH